MKLKAFAKINFSLRVFGKRSDGFHFIESIMQSISLCDYITVTPAISGIEITCDDPTVPINEQNICYKAAKLALRSGGVKIHIEKRIPIAAGLAGGSADAAAVLYALKAPELAAQVGSDVPFCLTGGTCLVKGRGEVVEKVDPWPKEYIIIVNPGIHISAKWAYDAFDDLNIAVPAQIKNDLEPVVASKYPVIAEIKERLIEMGCSEAQMSGSGSTVFGLTKDPDIAQHIYDQMKQKYGFCCIAKNIDQGIEVIEK